MTDSTARGSSDASTTWADSMATSVPAPIASPTSARASAGASLTPSPTMATVRPRCWSSATALSLSSGSTSANTSSMPRSSATASATCLASPVIITTFTPRACSASTASRDSARVWSSSARAPMTVPPRTTYSTAAPRSRQRPTAPVRASGTRRPDSRSSVGPPTVTSAPSTVAVTPRPVRDRKCEAVGTATRARAAVTMARASGCSESASTAAASASRVFTSPSTAAASTTVC